MLTNLTIEQETKLEEYRNKGIEIGLRTETVNIPFETIKQLTNDAYTNVGLKPPEIVLYVDSPMAGLQAVALLQEVDQVKNLVRDQVSDQVWNQVADQVGNQVWDQIITYVMIPVRSQIWGQIWGQIWRQINNKVENQIRHQINYQVSDQVWNQVVNQIREQVTGQIRDLVENQIQNQVRGQVWSQVEGQVEGQVKNQVNDKLNQLWENSRPFYGQHETFWLYHYKYFKDVCNIPNLEKIEPLIKLSENVGWCFLYENVAVITKRPKVIHLENTRLHNRNGPAIEYLDGYKLYAMNGVRFEVNMIKFIELPVNDLNPKEVLEIKNVEQRAEVIKRIGIDKFFNSLDKTLLETKNTYELYSIDLKAYKPRTYLKMNNPSVKGEIHIEAVHPDCKTINQALNWRNFGIITDEFIVPIRLT